MGQQHFDAMLAKATRELIQRTPTILALTLPYYSVFSAYADEFEANRLATGLGEIDKQFVSDLNALAAEGKIWVYYTSAGGAKIRANTAKFDDILEERETKLLWALLSL